MSSADSQQISPVGTDPGWVGPTIGVIGGNGPAATALFQDTLVRLTPADSDQEHLDLVVLVHSSQPDRTARILDSSAPDPGPVLARDAARLDALGTDFTVIPCNTAYYFVDTIAAATAQPLLSIVAETAKSAVEAVTSGSPRIGLLVTDGNRAAGIYEKALTDLGAQPVYPGEADQHLVMSIIYDGVKAGGPVDVDGLERVIDGLLEVSDVVVLGCTELSVIYAEQQWQDRHRLVDSIDALARATIRRAGREPLSGG